MGDYPPQYYSPRARKYYRKRPSVAGGGGAGGSVGGWVEVGRTTLGSAGDSIDITSLADKRYYMVLEYSLPSGTIDSYTQFNGDTSSSYSQRRSIDGGADTTNTNLTILDAIFNSGVAVPHFGVRYIANYSSKEKLTIGHYVRQNTSGSSNPPNRTEITSKWTNTSNAINRINTQNSSGGSFNTGSEVVVLGYDPADTHTTNFWEELYSGTATSGQILNTGTFTAKKYLWIQAMVKGTGNSTSFMRFNGDQGSNYTTRYSNDGGADGTYTSLTSGFEWITSSTPNPAFFNMFIINNASTEKLAIHHCVHNNTSGSSNVPSRFETVQKWTNTSNQITSIQLDRGSTGAHTNTIIKVWGAD
jgi:hypothetical protein